MTPKQEERLRNKIAKIRKELAADKKYWGGFYHDGRGLRYLPPELFIKLKDYKGGLRYLRWFDKAFPDDAGFPFFLFEWTLILFKTGKLKEAEKKAMYTFFSNNYLLDKFLGKESRVAQQEVESNGKSAAFADKLTYSKDDPELTDFVVWLELFLATEQFNSFASELFSINKKIETLPIGDTRSELIERRWRLIEE